MHRAGNVYSRVVFACLTAVAVASCGGEDDEAPPPGAPANVRVLPANGQLTVSWDAVAGATGYDVYSGSAPGISTASAKVTTGSTTQALLGANGTVTYVAVAARNDAGQGPLSAVSCGVPSPGGAPAAGFVLYDALCGSTLDGSLYTNAQLSRRIQGGALELEVTASNLESATRRGVRPASTMTISGSGASRVTTWQGTITVPAAATATRAGNATIQAALGLFYQPRANRLAFPGGQAKLISAQVGLQDTGAGLQFYRTVVLCADAACATTDSATNIVYANGTLPLGQPASYGTAYRISISLDEAARTFTYAISGAGLAGTTTGTADASALFAAQGVTPENDFSAAFVRARAYDPGAAGGGSGKLRATFDDVWSGLAGAAPALYDDFGALTIDPNRWTTGEASLAMNGGALEAKPSITGTSTAPVFSGMTLVPGSLPQSTNRIRVDVAIPASATAAAAGSENRFVLTRALYNDGTAGTTPPDVNQANSAVGDVQAQLVITPTAARFVLFRAATATGSGPILTKSPANPLPTSVTSPLGLGTRHTVAISWNPATHRVTFQLDDAAPVTVDPTSAADPLMATAAPVVGPRPHVESTFLASVAAIGGPSGAVGATGSATFRLNNVLVAP